MNLTNLETARFLRSVAVGNDQASAIGVAAADTHQDLAYFLVREWIVVAYWDERGFNYFDMVVSPQGDVGRYGEWRAEGALPEELLSPIEFAWLWGILDRADVISWTEDLSSRMKAAGRFSS